MTREPRAWRKRLALALLLVPPLLVAGERAAAGGAIGRGAAGGEPKGAPAEPPPESVLGRFPFLEGFLPTRVPLDLAPPGHRALRLMLDTGSPWSLATPRAARALGFSVRRHKSTPYRRATALGRDLQLRVATRRSDTGSDVGWEYALLGGNFLARYVVEIDFPARRVRFLDPKRYRVPEQTSAPDEAVLPLRLAASLPFVEVEIEGHPAWVLLDTGDPASVHISGGLARRMGIDVAALPRFGKQLWAAGETEAYFYEAKRIRIGPFEYRNLPVLVQPNGVYNVGGPTDSMIGCDLLLPFVVRIDFPRRRLWLRRVRELRPTLWGADYALARRLGAFLVPLGHTLLVRRVQARSPAAEYGLREGDRIVAPVGEKLLPIEEVASRILAREELTVARRHGDVWVDEVLPVSPGESP